MNGNKRVGFSPRAVFAVITLMTGAPILASSLGYTFTYQGKLTLGGAPLNGTTAADLRFTLYDHETDGDVVGDPVTVRGVDFSQGLFSVPLNFGEYSMAGPRWLGIEIARPTGSALNRIEAAANISK